MMIQGDPNNYKTKYLTVNLIKQIYHREVKRRSSKHSGNVLLHKPIIWILFSLQFSLGEQNSVSNVKYTVTGKNTIILNLGDDGWFPFLETKFSLPTWNLLLPPLNVTAFLSLKFTTDKHKATWHSKQRLVCLPNFEPFIILVS